MIINESELAERLAKGDRQAFRFIFKNYYRLLCLYAESFLKQSYGAEDAVQSVMVNIWEKREDISITTSVKSYLYGAVRNKCLNEYKRSKREEDFLTKYQIEALNDAIKQEEDQIQKRLSALNKEIEALPKKTKEIFILNKKNGYTYSEIAEFKKISERTVENHLYRAMNRIRTNLSKINLQIFI